LYEFFKFKSDQSSIIVQFTKVYFSTIRQFGDILMNMSTAHSARPNTNTHNLTQVKHCLTMS